MLVAKAALDSIKDRRVFIISELHSKDEISKIIDSWDIACLE